MKSNVEVINTLNLAIDRLESRSIEGVKLRPEYARLKSIPGIGDVLATIIMLETGDIARFAQVGNFASYARCVDSARYSNGNAYLVWAFVEAANFARRYSDEARRFFDKKKAKTNSIVTTKAWRTSWRVRATTC